MSRKSVLLASAIAAAAAGSAMKRAGRAWERQMCLRGKVVLITGGSRGLGVALARAFAAHGCKLVLCARDTRELELARQDLALSPESVLTVACDVSNRSDAESMVALAQQHFGTIDILVNNAGIIHVGPIHTMTVEDFESAMDVMFWGVVHCTNAVLPEMRRRGQGRIVNITSVGAKVSVPHLVPYCCAKFAAIAFSEGLRAELHGSGVKVVTIAPGLMRTGSHLNAVFKGAENNEAAWFSLGASLPAVSMNADRAAQQIVRATAAGTAERVLSIPASLLTLFHGLFPGLTADLLGVVNQALPQGRNKIETGAESQILKTPWLRAATTLGRKAAERYLQPTAVRS